MSNAQNEVDAILGRVDSALKDNLVPVEIFNNDAVHRAEMERIFAKCWIFVAHESEIPNAGDYVSRSIGLDPVIVTRGRDGAINVVSPFCRHRGTEVCQNDSGNAAFFKCPYHGWTYDLDGTFKGAPAAKELYGRPIDKEKWSLAKAPKVEVRNGFIFACLDQDGPSLEEYLGGGGWMWDLIFGLHPKGMRVAGPPDRYRVRANWKTAAENFSGDVYHLMTLHWSTQELNISEGLQFSAHIANNYEMDNGHNFVGHSWTKVIHPGFILWGYPEEIHQHFDLSALDETQLEVITHVPPTVGTIFPNLSFIRFAASKGPLAEGFPMSVVTSVRQWQPVGPDEMELWSWQMVWDFMSPEEVELSTDIGQYAFGSAGIFEQDDTMAWEGVPKMAAAPWASKAAPLLHFDQGNNGGASEPIPFDAPGTRTPTAMNERRQLAFYRKWLDVMNGKVSTPAKKG